MGWGVGQRRLVCLFAVGLATFVAGAVDVYRAGAQPLDLGLLAAVLLAAFVVWHRLDPRARFRAMAADPRGVADARSAGSAATTNLAPAATEPAPSQPTARVA